ncbi:hypothetical protein H6F86_16075 [Phormidium sp. FACHB-592]|uniref:Uncharacterized protein n=1 Tax=Stenomitos frigidus AS-A4 TaxID=2933935 RepID=A0ABV0KKY6_9CYAN|nr:hypothetical protein [Phormidium sp. FACHB-592]MBD2075386.1 hypothetical protein [Phormidium sp. FACHB-592]
MALGIIGPTKRSAIADEDLDLFTMIQAFDIKASQFKIIRKRFYQNPYVDVLTWLNEIYQLREAYFEQLIKEKNVRAKDSLVREQVLARLKQNDRWMLKFDELIAVCEDAIAADQGLRFLSD